MSKLALAVKALESSNVPHKEWLTDGSFDEFPPEVQAIVNAADAELIDSRGQSDLRVARQHGIRVTCGERDSFGWLSGVIHTAKGKVVYG